MPPVPPEHHIMDIKRVADPLFPNGKPVVVLRAQPGKKPSLTTGNDDTIQWHNQLPNGEDVTITVPFAKRVFKDMDASFDVSNFGDSPESTIKKNVPPVYKTTPNRANRYMVLLLQSGEYALGGSDPEIEIK